MIKKKAFVRYDEDTTSFCKSIWFSEDMRKLVFDVGVMLRQNEISNVIKQALEITKANLMNQEKTTNTLYDNGLRNKRKSR